MVSCRHGNCLATGNCAAPSVQGYEVALAHNLFSMTPPVMRNALAQAAAHPPLSKQQKALMKQQQKQSNAEAHIVMLSAWQVGVSRWSKMSEKARPWLQPVVLCLFF